MRLVIFEPDNYRNFFPIAHLRPTFALFCGCNNKKDTVAAIELSLALFDRFVRDGVDPEALEFSRRFTLGSAAFEIDTPDKRMKLAMDQVIFGFDQEAQLEAIRTLSKEQVDAAIRRHLDPENLLITVVCSAADLRSAIKSVPGVIGVEVTRYDALG